MRKPFVLLAGLLLAVGMLGSAALADEDGEDRPDDRGLAPPEEREDICDERHNNLNQEAEPIDLSDGDVEEHTVDDVTFWVVRHGVEYDRAVYREPARLGSDNFCFPGSDTGSFWFGIAGPDLTPIHHKGQASLYFETDPGEWQSLTAQFEDGDLIHVNGVEPE